MKFSISSTALSSKLQNLAKVLSAKPSIPILNNILFEIVDGVLTLTPWPSFAICCLMLYLRLKISSVFIFI